MVVDQKIRSEAEKSYESSNTKERWPEAEDVNAVNTSSNTRLMALQWSTHVLSLNDTPNLNKEEEKKEETTEEKKEEEKKDEEPPVIVLKVDMHCEACARKVAKALKGFEGVEEVTADSKASKVVVKGKAADPIKVCERLQKKSGKKVELISPLPKPPDEKKEEVKEPQPEQKKEEFVLFWFLVPVVSKEDGCYASMKARVTRATVVTIKRPNGVTFTGIVIYLVFTFYRARPVNSVRLYFMTKIVVFAPLAYSVQWETPHPPPVVTVVLQVRMHCEACAQVIEKGIRKIKGVESVETSLGNDQVIVKGVIDPAKLVDYVYKRTKKQASVVKEEEKEKKEEEEKEEKEEKKEGEENKGDDGEEEDENKTEIKRSEYMPMRSYVDYFDHLDYPYDSQIFSDENPNACSVIEATSCAVPVAGAWNKVHGSDEYFNALYMISTASLRVAFPIHGARCLAYCLYELSTYFLAKGWPELLQKRMMQSCRGGEPNSKRNMMHALQSANLWSNGTFKIAKIKQWLWQKTATPSSRKRYDHSSGALREIFCSRKVTSLHLRY
ncbi:hypothetical protein V8G54_032077 [Vigna mungo]|uniref:HMA domain-containing protein n=1 Tax=Vigna mungo TaxID=3915 RepID=A0AAQ3MLC0_VIGMU